MKKILYVVSTLQNSGPTNQLYNIIKNINRSEFEPYVLTLSGEPTDTKWDDYAKLNIELDSLGLSRVEGVVFGKKRLKSAIFKICPDIIHTQGFRADVLLSTLQQSAKWVLTSRNYPREDYPMKFGILKGGYMAVRHILAMKKCKNIVACSKSISAQLSKHSLDSTAIQNGVSLDRRADIQSSTELFGRVLERPIFITVGSLISRKNVNHLVDSFNCYGAIQQGTLVVLGDGPLRQSLESTAKKNICFLGNVDSVAEYLVAADYFVSASLSEGLPNTVLEALAAGLPCLLSDIPSHREIHEICSSSTRIFNLTDENDLPLLLSEVQSLFDENAPFEAVKVATSVFSDVSNSSKYQSYYVNMLMEQL